MAENMKQVTTRRTAIKGALSCLTAGIVWSPWSTPTALAGPDASLELADSFMQKHNVPALSYTIAKNGYILDQQALGVMDLDTHQRLTVSNLFRIASISKPFTSVALFTLIEQGKVHLNDKIFGPQGILGTDFGGPPYRAFVEEITVDHLLTHTCGGWPGNEADPLDRFPELSASQLIVWTIANVPLDHRPGEHWMYSNFGYVLLGRVIEKVSGKPYAKFLRDAVLARCEATNMRIAGNTPQEIVPGEVTYYGQDDGDPYQGNHHRADASGGWIATATDLVRFASNVRGFSAENSLLRKETVAIMTKPCSIHSSYARGWDVDPYGNWWHNGGMPGTTSAMFTNPTGLCWAALTNTSRATVEINNDLDRLLKRLASIRTFIVFP
jgi:CubicO group peptidase (beta-lactamase class C family)